MKARYEQFPHTADIGVRAFGKNLPELFENAAFAMFDIMADLEGLKGGTPEEISLKADTPEELLVDWLDELLYDFCTRKIIFFDFKVHEMDGKALKATVYGRPVSANPNRLKTEIKAATYSELKIKKSDSGYQTEIIFDV